MDEQDCYLAIDQGTHASRAILFDRQGAKLASFTVDLQPLVQDAPDCANWVEYDTRKLLVSVQQSIQQAIQFASDAQLTIKAAGLATQRSSVVAWNRTTGEPLSSVISWQDRRQSDWIESNLKQHAAKIQSITGLPLNPHYGASKIAWLIKNEPLVADARASGELLCGPLASLLVYSLIAGAPQVVDHANALRTQLMSLHDLEWVPWLIEAFDVPGLVLPELRPTVDDYGRLHGTDIPLRAVHGDQSAALFGSGAPKIGQALVNLGTGGFVVLPIERPLEVAQLLAGIANSKEHQGRVTTELVLEGTVNGCGAALNWAIESLAIEEPYDRLERALQLEPGSHKLRFFNGVNGLGSPWWQSTDIREWWSVDNGQKIEAKEMDAATRNEALAAVAESIVFLVQANLQAMIQGGAYIDSIRISGGVSHSDGICQMLATLSGLDVHRTTEQESTSRGVAWLASGRRAGWHQSRVERRPAFVPRTNELLTTRYDEYCQWLSARS